MAGGSGKRSKGSGSRSRQGKASKAPARPVLGNDPFTRGAAAREGERTATATAEVVRAGRGVVAAAPPPEPVRAEERTDERSRKADPHARLAEVEQRIERALDGAEARLAAVAARAGVGQGSADLREAATRLVPALRDKLGSLKDLALVFEPPARLDRHGMDQRLVERAEPIVELLYASWWRTSVRGIERVPSTGPALVVANHAGLVPWDALVLRHALRRDHPAHRELRPLLDDREADAPFIGPIAIRLGAVRAGPEPAERLLRDGTLVGVFPEGSAGARKPWRDRYRIQHFGRGGFVKLALRTGAPIVPCAIVGSEEASPGISRTGWLAEQLGIPLLSANPLFRLAPAAVFPLPSRWTLRFGEPIEVGPASAAAAEDAAMVRTLTERVRATLQAMLDEDVAARGSVFL
jgi:1-acyl-sn-glycerol-3-phosphate acyltransferase